MSALRSVRAQDGAVRALLRAREHGRVASAYVFDGPDAPGPGGIHVGSGTFEQELTFRMQFTAK